jgi:hypothetical protein
MHGIVAHASPWSSGDNLYPFMKLGALELAPYRRLGEARDIEISRARRVG